MSVRTLICEFGSESKLAFYFEAEASAFNYTLGTRDITFRIVAMSEHDGQVSLMGSGVGQLSVFGKTYLLPSSISLLRGEASVLSTTVRGISGSDYVSAALVELTLKYSSDVYGSCSGVFSTSVALPKMYYRPEISVTGERIALGGMIRFTGAMLSEGYYITAEVCRDSGEILMIANIDDYRSELEAAPEWITPYPENRKFSGYIRIRASFNGVALPEALEISREFYLPIDVGVPSVSIAESFVSENELIASLGVGVRNRSSLNVVLSNATAYCGARITERRIIYNGLTYTAGYLATDVLTEVGKHSYTVRVIDSRGSVYTEVRSFEVWDYGPPVFSAAVTRVDSVGAESKGGKCISVTATVDTQYSFGGVNEYKLYYSYARPGMPPLCDKTEFVRNGQCLIDLGLEPTLVYEVTIYCEDTFGSSSECKYMLDCERVELNIAKNKIGIGKYATEEYLLDCAWGIRSGGDLIFTDELGNEVSARETLGGGAVFGISYVMLEEHLSQLLSPQTNGIRIELVNVAAPNLSYSSGWHVFLTYKNDVGSGYFELKTL